MKKLIWPAMAAALLSLSCLSVKAQANESLTVTTVSHGVHLTLAVPQQQYPYNSVVRVQVSVQNSSHSPVTVTGFPRNCISENPSVEVLDTSGSVVYPPSPLHFISPPCPTLTPGHEGRVLQPGKSLQVVLYALLRGDQIRAALTILRGQNAYVIKSGSVAVQVRAAESPQAHVLVQPAMPASIDVST